MIRVLVADDHHLVRHGVRLVIDAEDDMTVVEEAQTTSTALAHARRTRPDVIVLDMSLPDAGALAVLPHFRDALRSTAFVLFTRHRERQYMQTALANGASAYVLKCSASRELLRGIRAAAAGDRYVDRAFDPHVSAPACAPAPLSVRDATIVRLAAIGHTPQAVAALLRLTPEAVDAQQRRAMAALGLAGPSDLLEYAARRGWLADVEAVSPVSAPHGSDADAGLRPARLPDQLG